MAERLSLDELKSYLWGAAVLLRTHIDAGAYKQYIFPLLFFKRLNDVYEEETGNVYMDRSDEIMEHSVTSRLLSFPNVLITSHQGFYTKEALAAIAQTTLQNLKDAEAGIRNDNDVA